MVIAMKKRELLKHAEPGLKFSPGNGLLHAEQLTYIVRTAVKNIDGRRVLLVHLYDREQLAAATDGDTGCGDTNSGGCDSGNTSNGGNISSSDISTNGSDDRRRSSYVYNLSDERRVRVA